MDDSLLKNELNVKLKKKDKKILIKNKNNDGATIHNVSQIGENQTINNYNQIILTDKQLEPLISHVINKGAKLLIEELKKYPFEILDKAFQEIDPLFLFLHRSKDFSKEQIDILISKNIESSLRKQAIEKISLLTLQDIELLKIIKSIDDLTELLVCNYEHNWYDKEFVTINQNGKKIISKKTIEEIKIDVNLKISSIEKKLLNYEQKYGNIKYQNFENLLNNNVIKNDKNTHDPLLEFVYKLFIDYSLDKTKNKEYYEENIQLRATKRRKFWTNWFNDEKYKGTDIENIKNKLLVLFKKIPMINYYEEKNDCNMYFSISFVGFTILDKLK